MGQRSAKQKEERQAADLEVHAAGARAVDQPAACRLVAVDNAAGEGKVARRGGEVRVEEEANPPRTHAGAVARVLEDVEALRIVLDGG